jgi:hypothetical protein
MPIQVSWANAEKTVVLCVFSENWTLDEFHDMVDEMHSLISSVNHTVHSISDFSSSKTSPAKLLSVGRHVENKSSGNMGINISVGANAFLKAITNVAQRMFLKDTELYFADSLEHAYHIITKHEQARSRH